MNDARPQRVGVQRGTHCRHGIQVPAKATAGYDWTPSLTPKIRFAGFGQPNGIHPPSRPTAHRHFMFARRPEVGFAHKEKLSYEQRCYESTRVREKYSDRFPVIVERDSNSAVPVVDKCAVATTRAREMSRTRTLSSVCTSRKRALTTRYPHALTPPTGAST